MFGSILKTTDVCGIIRSDEAEVIFACDYADDVIGCFCLSGNPVFIGGGTSPSIGGGAPGEQLGGEASSEYSL